MRALVKQYAMPRRSFERFVRELWNASYPDNPIEIPDYARSIGLDLAGHL